MKHTENGAFTWETRGGNMWVLLYNGKLLTRLVRNNAKSFSIQVVRGDDYTYQGTLTNAKIKAVNLTRKTFTEFRDYEQSQPSVDYVNKHLSAAALAKHGKAVRIEPVAFDTSAYRITFESGYQQDSKIPKRNPSSREVAKCKKVLREAETDDLSYIKHIPISAGFDWEENPATVWEVIDLETNKILFTTNDSQAERWNNDERYKVRASPQRRPVQGYNTWMLNSRTDDYSLKLGFDNARKFQKGKNGVDNHGRNIGGFPVAIMRLVNEIKESQHGKPEDQLTDFEASHLIPAYRHVFENDHGYIKLTPLGKKLHIVNGELKVKNSAVKNAFGHSRSNTTKQKLQDVLALIVGVTPELYNKSTEGKLRGLIGEKWNSVNKYTLELIARDYPVIFRQFEKYRNGAAVANPKTREELYSEYAVLQKAKAKTPLKTLSPNELDEVYPLTVAGGKGLVVVTTANRLELTQKGLIAYNAMKRYLGYKKNEAATDFNKAAVANPVTDFGGYAIATRHSIRQIREELTSGTKNIVSVIASHSKKLSRDYGVPVWMVEMQIKKGLEDIQYRKKNESAGDFKRFTKDRLIELSEMFQGEASGARNRALSPDMLPAETWRLGYLVQMKIRHDGKVNTINFDGESYLVGDLRCNLWTVGKDARIEGIRKPSEGQLKKLGKLIQVDYVTAKKHIEGGKMVRFWHPLGEVNKDYPTLYIDHDGFPIILGGGYDVWNVGIVN